ncbi:hypothetical protein HRbin33_00531 [bacterium HR33]|nr:hypothetical protein HRbin33_00531 [bacterium HR33]
MAHHIDRRRFVSLLSAAGAGLAFRTDQTGAARIEAETTVFWSQPDGRDTLVRFFISDIDAPAARLRVFDSAGRFIGTAGAIRIAEARLYGELWLPLSGPLTITTELAIPGERPIRSTHSLRPKPKWSIYWLTVLSAEDLEQRLAPLPLFRRSVELALLKRRRAAVNPVPADPQELQLLDHLDFLHSLKPATRAASELGLELSRVAVARRFQDMPAALALLLRDAGVGFAVATEELEPAAYWLEGPGEARVLVVPGLGFSGTAGLDFSRGGDAMKSAVERWLAALAAAHPSPEPMALVVDCALQDDSDASYRNVEAWNRLYAYPRIVVGEADEFFRRRTLRAAPISAGHNGARGAVDPPPVLQVSSAAAARDEARQRRTAGLIAAFAQALGSSPEQLGGKPIFPLPGWLVFNPSPFTRSDLVEVGSGLFRLVTDVPGTGYVYVADLSGDRPVSWRAEGPAGSDDLVLENERFRVRLSPETGGIESVLDRFSGYEWVDSSGELNGVPAARLEEAVRHELDGLASRISLRRWAPGRGTVETAVTLYRDRNWIEVENRAEAVGDQAVPYRFDFALMSPELLWETPLGIARGAGVERVAALRWIRLRGTEGRAYVSAIDAPLVSVSEDRHLTFWGPRGRARFRLALAGAAEFAREDEAWRFGWSIEPFVAIPVAGGGELPLPRWGSLFALREPGVAILGVEPAAPGEAVVYLQELLGVARRLALGPGVLTFESATLLDLSGKTQDSAEADPTGGVTVPLAPRGVAAVRLEGVAPART